MPARKSPPVPQGLTVEFNKGRHEIKLEKAIQSKNQKAINFMKLCGNKSGVRCPDCQEVLPLYAYKADKKNAYGLYLKQCGSCLNDKNCPFKRLVYNARGNTKLKLKNGREMAPVNVDATFLKNLFRKQKGLCAYSGLKMEAKNRDGNPYNVSLERKNNTKGYQTDNVVLICTFLQFPHGGDFDERTTKELIFYNPEEDNYTFNLGEFVEEYHFIEPRRKYRKTNPVKDVDGNVTHKTCTDCATQKPIGEFNGQRSHCKPCKCLSNKNNRNTIKGFIHKMKGDAKKDADERSRKRTRDDNAGVYDDNLHALFLDVIITQGNRCAITGIPFVYEQNHPHVPSPDRLDNKKGYVEGNIQMVVTPINTRHMPSNEVYRQIRENHFKRLMN